MHRRSEGQWADSPVDSPVTTVLAVVDGGAAPAGGVDGSCGCFCCCRRCCYRVIVVVVGSAMLVVLGRLDSPPCVLVPGDGGPADGTQRLVVVSGRVLEVLAETARVEKVLTLEPGSKRTRGSKGVRRRGLRNIFYVHSSSACLRYDTPYITPTRHSSRPVIKSLSARKWYQHYIYGFSSPTTRLCCTGGRSVR